MKFLNILLLAATATALVAEPQPRNARGLAALSPRHHKGKGKANAGAAASKATNNGAAATSASTAIASAAATNAVTDAAAGQTLVLKEVGGVPGNECLTFRNNGEIVDAACVNTAADRQITPSAIGGASALLVQRTFTAGFRPDLVGVQACVGFNGTHFRAEDCAATGVEKVTFTGGELTASGGACASGHDGQAQLTVDTAGATCASFTSTKVTATKA